MDPEKKIRLDLSGIRLAKPAAYPIAQKAAGGGGDEQVITPPRAAPGPGFLSKALARRHKSFQERLQEAPDAPPPSSSSSSSSSPSGQMSPESFAMAVMKGMGWTEGRPIRPGGPQEAVQYVPLPGGVGLGYHHQSVDNTTRPVFAKHFDSDTGRVRNVVGVSEELRRVESLRIGSPVSVVRGPHSGMTGRIRCLHADSCSVELDSSGAVVSVRRDDTSQCGGDTPVLPPAGPVLGSPAFPAGSVCRVASKTALSGSLYHRTVLVTGTEPTLSVRFEERTVRGLAMQDLAGVRPRPGEGAIVVNPESPRFGHAGSCIVVTDDLATVLFDDGEAVQVKVSEVTVYRN